MTETPTTPPQRIPLVALDRLPDEMRKHLPALADELGIGGVGVPIFDTLAEAEAWEAAHPGKTALTLEASTPDTTAPTAGTLSVTVKDKTATGTVSGASDDRAVTGYAFRVGSGAWSAWQSSPAFEFTGLSASTPYWFQHQTRDAAGNVTVGTAVQATTLAALPVTDDYIYQWLGSQAGGSTWTDTKSGLAASLVGNAPTVEDQWANFAATSGSYGPFNLSKITSATPTYVAVWHTTQATLDANKMGAAIGAHGVAGALGIYTVGGGLQAMQPQINGAQVAVSPATGTTTLDRKNVGIVRFASGSTVQMFNGTSSTATATFDAAAVPTAGVYLAAGVGNTDYVGRLAEVRIYNRRLTDAEVTALRDELKTTYGTV